MNFAARLRNWRLESGLTQRELARRANLNFSYLSKIEAGLVPAPSLEKIRALSKALNRTNDETNQMIRMAQETRISNDVVKAALVRNPGVGALLRRIQNRRLTHEELTALLEIVDDDAEWSKDSHN